MTEMYEEKTDKCRHCEQVQCANFFISHTIQKHDETDVKIQSYIDMLTKFIESLSITTDGIEFAQVVECLHITVSLV